MVQIPDGEGGTKIVGPGDTPSDRRISLADLTVNRHIRRGDSHQLDVIRQNSTSSGELLSVSNFGRSTSLRAKELAHAMKI